jgi:hypothetical protein
MISRIKILEFQDIVLLISKKLLKFQSVILLISKKLLKLYIYILNCQSA